MRVAAWIAVVGCYAVAYGGGGLAAILLLHGFWPAGLIMVALAIGWLYVAQAWINFLRTIQNERRNLRE